MSATPAPAAPDSGSAPAGLMLARRWSLIASVALAAGIALVLLAGPALYRLHLLSLEIAMWGLAKVALWLSVACLAVSIVCIVTAGMRQPKRAVIIGIVTFTAALLAVARLWLLLGQRESMPPIYDVQTDWARPVAFSAETMAARGDANAAPLGVRIGSDGGAWAGKTFEEAQRDYYSASEVTEPTKPGVVPKQVYKGLESLRVDMSVEASRKGVEVAMKELGWTITRGADSGGVIEGRNTSTWYGLVADIAVRVEPDGDKTRIDVRSASRTPGSDLGANATRVKNLVDSLAMALRPEG